MSLSPPLLTLSLTAFAGFSQSAPSQGHELDFATPAFVSFEGSPGANVQATLVIEGQVVHLDLEPANVTASDFGLWTVDAEGNLERHEPEVARTYRGRTDAFGGAAIAASWLDRGLVARIATSSGEDFWLEPAEGALGAPGEHVFYRGADAGALGSRCAVGLQPLPAMEELVSSVTFSSAGQAAAGPLRVAEIACDTDVRFFKSLGSIAAVNDRIQGFLNIVNLQFERDVDLTHRLTAIVVRTSRGKDPYSTRNPHLLLGQMAAEWENNMTAIRRDLVHLFIARPLKFGQGIASLDAVCTRLGNSVSEPDACSTFACATDLIAHELGHNWGARHCGCPNGTMGGGGNRFADESQAQIRAFAATRTCLSVPCPSPAVLNRTAGKNLPAYVATPAAVGVPTVLRVDTQGFRFATVFGYGLADQHALGSGFVVLVNLSEPPVFVLGPLQGPVVDASVTMAVRPSMCGTTVYTQALLHDSPGTFALSNAQDLVIGS